MFLFIDVANPRKEIAPCTVYLPVQPALNNTCRLFDVNKRKCSDYLLGDITSRFTSMDVWVSVKSSSHIFI